MEHARRQDSERRDDAVAGGVRSRRQAGPGGSPPQLALLALQRSAGNAAVAQLVGGGSPVQRQPAPAEAQPQPAQPRVPATDAAQAPQSGQAATASPAAGPKHPTDWFVDFDQVNGAGGKLGERGEKD